MKNEIWIDEESLKELYKSGSVITRLRTEIQSIPQVQLVEADLDMAAKIDRLHAINAELIEALDKVLNTRDSNEIVGRDVDMHPLNALGVARKHAYQLVKKAKQ